MAFEVIGKLKRAFIDPETGRTNLVLQINDKVEVDAINSLGKWEQLRINLTKYSKKRSKDANALLWACIGDIARATKSTKEEVYRQLLRDWGVSDFVVIKRSALPRFKASLGVDIKFCEEYNLVPVGLNKVEGVQVKVFYGSHLYNVEEFSRLIEGAIMEMENLGLQPPPSEDMKNLLEQMEADRKKAKEGYY